MAEPPATTPEQAGANGSDGPLGTNLYLLRPQPGFVSRPRLVERLQEGLAWGHFPAAGWCGSMHSKGRRSGHLGQPGGAGGADRT